MRLTLSVIESATRDFPDDFEGKTGAVPAHFSDSILSFAPIGDDIY